MKKKQVFKTVATHLLKQNAVSMDGGAVMVFSAIGLMLIALTAE
jgi:hypothetical protein